MVIIKLSAFGSATLVTSPQVKKTASQSELTFSAKPEINIYLIPDLLAVKCDIRFSRLNGGNSGVKLLKTILDGYVACQTQWRKCATSTSAVSK